MIAMPRIETDRLVLREPSEADLPVMPGVFHDREIYEYTRNIPYPYTPEDARACLRRYHALARDGAAVTLFAELRERGELIGLVTLALASGRPEAELGYALGRRWWGRGLATEASRAMLGHGFGALGLEEINAHAMLRNPASSRVLAKLGMRSVGVIRNACEKDGRRHDAEGFVITRSEWTQQ